MDRDRDKDMDMDRDRHRDTDMDTDKDMDTDRETDPERDMVMSPSSQLKNQLRSKFCHCFPRKTALRRHLNTVRLLYGATLYRTAAVSKPQYRHAAVRYKVALYSRRTVWP
jgi:hypothetical protein